VRLRTVALPTEHGGWGFTLEPVLLGLLAAWSPAGLLIGAAALGLFLAHRPARLVLGDLRARRRADRTPAAGAFAAGYGLVAAAALGAAFAVTEHSFWPPLAAAVPLLAIQALYEASRRTRHPVREILGPAALGSVAAAIGLAGGMDSTPAFGLWLVLAARVLVSVPYVRVQVRRLRDRPAAPMPTLALQAATLAGTAAAAAAAWIPWSAVASLAILTAVEVATLRFPPPRVTVLGIGQVIAGLFVVLGTALGL
jgi:hypothetical protein